MEELIKEIDNIRNNKILPIDKKIKELEEQIKELKRLKLDKEWEIKHYEDDIKDVLQRLGKVKLDFGKHKGKTLKEVVLKDYFYFCWIEENNIKHFKLDVKDLIYFKYNVCGRNRPEEPIWDWDANESKDTYSKHELM